MISAQSAYWELGLISFIRLGRNHHDIVKIKSDLAENVHTADQWSNPIAPIAACRNCDLEELFWCVVVCFSGKTARTGPPNNPSSWADRTRKNIPPSAMPQQQPPQMQNRGPPPGGFQVLYLIFQNDVFSGKIDVTPILFKSSNFCGRKSRYLV